MNKKAFETLEFDKVLRRLAEFTDNEEVKEKILALEPALSKSEAKQRLSETTEAVGLILRRGNPQSLKITNVSGSAMRANMGGLLTIKDLIAVRDLSIVCGNLKRYVSDDKSLPNGSVLSLTSRISTLSELRRRIEEVIISIEEIANTASPELFNIRRKIRAQSAKIRETLNFVISSAKYQKALQEPIITQRGDRYVVPVKAECKNEISGIVHDSSSSGATLFIEPMAVVELTNSLSGLYGKEKEEIDRIIAELSAFVGGFAQEIKENVTAVFTIDFLFSKAKLSIELNAVEPNLNEDGFIKIDKGRHPLLVPDKVVPVDIYLGGDFDTLIITGPNTGGKTVSLKTLGLFTIMALSGLHISAGENSSISFFEEVFADIGDEQSIEQSLSTFSAHIVNLVGILKEVNDKSLVLADELGAGTDPTEGAALAIAILEFCRGRGARFAATTHYSELKLYALSTPGVENASCEFDIKTLSPTYKLLIGVPGKSNAFAISKRLGLDDGIIKRASELLHDDSVKLEDILSKLEENRQRSEFLKSKAEAMERDASKMKRNVSRERENLDAKQKKILEEARVEALRIIDSAKEESQKVLKELRQIRSSDSFSQAQQAAQKARDTLREQEDKISKSVAAGQKRSMKPPENLRPGDDVIILSLNQEAHVLTLPDSAGNLQVQAGIMKVKVNIKDLARTKKGKEPVLKVKATGVVTGKTADAKTEIDVRGMLVDEAVMVVDKFIDNSVMASLGTVTIIHGKGTGALKAGIGEYLKRHRSVESFRPGKYGEGEHGVTVITLK